MLVARARKEVIDYTDRFFDTKHIVFLKYYLSITRCASGINDRGEPRPLSRIVSYHVIERTTMKTTDQEESVDEKTQPITAASGPVATKQASKPLVWGAVGVIVAAGLVASYLIGYTIAKHHHRENISAIERRQGRAKSDI